MNNEYIKIVYESEPIGPEHIVLYLTTFDIDKYNKDLNKKEVAIKIPIEKDELYENNEYLIFLEKQLNHYVKNFYGPYVEETRAYLNFLKTTHTIEPKNYDDVKNINNVAKVTCNNIYGNVNNCEVLYCNEIKGKVINCDKIVYKGDEL